MKCNGGIIVDGTPYGFEGMLNSILNGGGATGDGIKAHNWAESAIEIMNNEIHPLLTQLQERFARTSHLFLSNDDLKLVNKYLSQCEKRFNEVAVKVHNAKTLL